MLATLPRLWVRGAIVLSCFAGYHSLIHGQEPSRAERASAILGEWCLENSEDRCFRYVRTGPGSFKSIVTRQPNARQHYMDIYQKLSYDGEDKYSGKQFQQGFEPRVIVIDVKVNGDVLSLYSHNSGRTSTYVRRVAALLRGHWQGSFKWKDAEWETGLSACLLQKGSMVNGCYEWRRGKERRKGKGELGGIINGKRLDFEYDDDDCKGKGHFDIRENGFKLEGTYSCGRETGLWNMKMLDQVRCACDELEINPGGPPRQEPGSYADFIEEVRSLWPLKVRQWFRRWEQAQAIQ